MKDQNQFVKLNQRGNYFMVALLVVLAVLVYGMMNPIRLGASVKWNMPTAYGDGYFQTKNIREFVADVKRDTQGEVNIIVHSGASLYPATEIFRAVRGGQAEIGELIMANMGNEDPLFNVDSIPFLAVNYQEAKSIWTVSRPYIEKKLDRLGLVLLYAVPWPPQNFYTKEPLNDVSFFKGRKLRAYNAITSQMANLLGAAPTTVQVPEIPQAFSTGIIDAMITSGATGVSSQSWDYIDYYTEVQAWMPKNMIFVNKKKWRRLSAKHRKVIIGLAEKAETRGWKYSIAANDSDRKILKSKGVVVSAPNQKILQDLKKIGKEMTDKWISQTGRVGKELIQKYRQIK